MIDARSSTRRQLFLVLTVLVLASLPPRLRALQEEPPKKPRDVSHFNLGKDKLALQGYDPVAYFPEGGGKPKKGLVTLTLEHEGARYCFASESNQRHFRATPAKYEPQYGGWCAYAMAERDKVEIDPKSFLITDGKLHLFFKAWYADTRAKWLQDEKGLKEKADGAWKVLNAPLPPK